MATASTTDVEPNLTECTVCNETVTVPKILPCGHLICRDCLVNWLRSKPLYRSAAVDPKQRGDRSVEEVADSFPTDLAMSAMVEVDILLSQQHVCCVCVNVAAVVLCLQCGDMLCQHCSKVHMQQSLSKHHDWRDLRRLTSEKLAAHHPTTCPDHKEEPSEVYCPTHGASVCLLCVTTNPRQGSEVVSLQSEVDDWAKQLAQLKAMLVEAEVKVDASHYLLDKRVKELKSQSQVALDQMKFVCDRFKAAIDARFLEVSDTIQNVVVDVTKIATDAKQSMLNKCTNMTKLYQSFIEHRSVCDITSIVKIRVQELDFALTVNLQMNHKVTVTIDHQAVAHIEQELSRLGQVSMTPVLRDTKAQAQAATSAQGLSSDVVAHIVKPFGVSQENHKRDVIQSGQSVDQPTKNQNCEHKAAYDGSTRTNNTECGADQGVESGAGVGEDDGCEGGAGTVGGGVDGSDGGAGGTHHYSIFNTTVNISPESNVNLQIGVNNSMSHLTENPGPIAWLRWDLQQERQRVDTLRQVMNQVQDRCRLLSEQQQTDRNDRQKVVALQRELDNQRQRLAELNQQFQQEGERERQQYRSFSISLEGANVVTSPDEGQRLVEVSEALFREFHVRLLGMEPGPTFILDTPVAQWSEVQSRRRDIQAILERLLSTDRVDDVIWGDVTENDIDLRINRLNVAQAQAATSAQGLSSDVVTDMVRPSDVSQQQDEWDLIDSTSDRFALSVGQRTKGVLIRPDPMKATASSVATIKTHIQSERKSCITCIAVGPCSEHLYMADSDNAAIKVFSLNPDRLLSILTLDVKPLRVAVVSDSLLVSTSSNNNVLVLIDVSSKLRPRVKSSVKTKRRYIGVGVMTSNSDDTTLVVSCDKEAAGPSSVDVITLTGEVIRTIITSLTLPDLTSPRYLHVDTRRGVLYISDYNSYCVWCVQLTTGRVLQTLKHPRMSLPRQVCTDIAGNLYVTSVRGECVLVKSVGDKWRVLLSGNRQREGKYVHPVGISVTVTGLVVSWSDCNDTAVKKYDLV